MEIAVILIFGLPILLWALDRGSYRACRTCKSKVRRDALRCAACGADPKAHVAQR